MFDSIRISRHGYLVIAVILISLSLLIKLDAIGTSNILYGLRYSDIEIGVFLDRFLYTDDGGKKWFNINKLVALKNGDDVCPLVYKDYHFEYPPIIGLIWQLTTCISFRLVYFHHYNVNEYSEMIQSAAHINLFLNAIIIGVCFIALIHVLLKKSLIDHEKITYILLSPSVLVYLFYNWDILCLFFFALALISHSARSSFKTGLYAGLSVSTKLLTLVPTLLISYDVMRRNRSEFKRFVIGFFMGGVLPFVILFFYSPVGLKGFVHQHSSWYCENCVYMLFIDDIWSSMHKYLFEFSIVATVILGMILVEKGINVHIISFYTLAGTLSLSYIFTPQMFLLLVPLSPIFISKANQKLFLLIDSLNALFIIVFFYEINLRFNPWEFGSLAQILAQSRNLLLLFIFLEFLCQSLKINK